MALNWTLIIFWKTDYKTTEEDLKSFDVVCLIITLDILASIWVLTYFDDDVLDYSPHQTSLIIKMINKSFKKVCQKTKVYIYKRWQRDRSKGLQIDDGGEDDRG